MRSRLFFLMGVGGWPAGELRQRPNVDRVGLENRPSCVLLESVAEGGGGHDDIFEHARCLGPSLNLGYANKMDAGSVSI